MEKICGTCAVFGTGRCPYSNGKIPENLEYGCFRYVKILPLHNENQQPSSCGKCRFLFRKAKADMADRSFVMCGCVASLTQKVKPSPNCPHFKPIRKKQAKKRLSKPFNRGGKQ